jgi:hypothetical protein
MLDSESNTTPICVVLKPFKYITKNMPLQNGYKQHHVTHTDNTCTSSADATITYIWLLCA